MSYCRHAYCCRYDQFISAAANSEAMDKSTEWKVDEVEKESVGGGVFFRSSSVARHTRSTSVVIAVLPAYRHQLPEYLSFH
jgi:hypothetical protein